MCDCADKVSDSNLSGILPGTSSDTFCQSKTQQFYADPCDCTKYVQCSNQITFLQTCGSGTMWSQSSLACVAGSCSAASPGLHLHQSRHLPAAHPLHHLLLQLPPACPRHHLLLQLPQEAVQQVLLKAKSQKIAFMSPSPQQCCCHCLHALVLCSCRCYLLPHQALHVCVERKSIAMCAFVESVCSQKAKAYHDACLW